jgi:hypothetical protein
VLVCDEQPKKMPLCLHSRQVSNDNKDLTGILKIFHNTIQVTPVAILPHPFVSLIYLNYPTALLLLFSIYNLIFPPGRVLPKERSSFESAV